LRKKIRLNRKSGGLVAFRFSDLWRWDGRVARRTYFLTGFIGFALKHNLDRFVSAMFFGRKMGIFDYWEPLGRAAHVTRLSSVDAKWLALLLVTALPFIWVGLVMTVQRLRDAGQPVWFATLFFAPFVNLLFFLWLCLIPSANYATGNEAAPWASSRRIGDWLPYSEWGSAILSIFITVFLGLFSVAILTKVAGEYGWSLFVALPFCLGLFATLLHSYRTPRSVGECLKVSILPIVAVGILLFAVAMEGIICLAMAAPLALLLAILGGCLGYRIQAAHWGPSQSQAILGLILLGMPGFAGVEYWIAPKATIFRVQSSIEVNAPPELVWQKVVAFAEIAPPTELLFRSGIAYPIRAEISGRGPGAIRHCVFSTGAFVEPITVWDEPRLLQFSVTENPPPLHELSVYESVKPRHLYGHFISHQGQFLLTALPGGRTRIEGTTWYSDALWPEAYWHLWSDFVIHRIHLRVLKHIRQEAENAVAHAR
jgi:uncharacterized membrane protein YhaH (DUF805 family)